jgi:hypothetical protein
MIAMASFEQAAASFWHPENEQLRQAPLTDESIVDAENQLGVTLPPDLIHLLRLQNGGVIADTWDACPADTNFYAGDHGPFDHLYGIGPAGQTRTTTLLDTPYLVQEWDLPSPVVLLSGQGQLLGRPRLPRLRTSRKFTSRLDRQRDGAQAATRTRLPGLRRAADSIGQLHPVSARLAHRNLPGFYGKKSSLFAIEDEAPQVSVLPCLA